MINAERRGVIAGSEEARKGGRLPENGVKQLANQVFDFMKKNGYVPIEPKSDFINGFYQGYKFANAYSL